MALAEDRQKQAFLILFCFAVSFFLATRIFMDLKQNTRLSKEYRKSTTNVKTLEEISEEKIKDLEEKAEKASAYLDKKIPSKEQTLNMMNQITRIPQGSSIVFKSINRLTPQNRNDYIVSYIDINAKSNLYDFVQFLNDLNKGALFISVDKLNIEAAQEREIGTLNIATTVSGYQIVKPPRPVSDILEDENALLDFSNIESLLGAVEFEITPIDLSSVAGFSPFAEKVTFITQEQPRVQVGESSLPQLRFRGAAYIKDKKAALINDRVVKIGDEIEGMRVIDIQRFKVTLSLQGKRYTLELGKEGFQDIR